MRPFLFLVLIASVIAGCGSEPAEAPATASMPVPAAATPVPSPAPTPEATPADPLAHAAQLLQQASARWQQGDKMGSLELAEKALAIYEEKLGPKHDKTVEVKVMVTKAKMEIMLPRGRFQ